jgi:hypothetical protein
MKVDRKGVDTPLNGNVVVREIKDRLTGNGEVVR